MFAEEATCVYPPRGLASLWFRSSVVFVIPLQRTVDTICCVCASEKSLVVVSGLY